MDLKSGYLRIIPFSPEDAGFNMAADDLLFRRGEFCLRFYGWRKPSLSLGKFKQSLEEIDWDYCAQTGIPVVVRKTGGKTVLHDLELTYSFVGPGKDFPYGVLDTYKIISRFIAEALSKLEIKVDMPDSKGDDNSSVCFREISRFEISSSGRKIIGSAQHRNQRAILQHGSILLDAKWDVWKKIWKGRFSEEEFRSRVLPLRTIKPNLKIEDLSASIVEQFVLGLGLEAVNQPFDINELKEIASLSSKFLYEPANRL